MRTMLAALGAALALLAAQAARGDEFLYADGQTVSGSLEDITVVCDGTHGIYPRKAISALQLKPDAGVAVLLASGARRTGKLVSLRFRSADGLFTVPGAKVAGLELKDDEAREALDAILEKAVGGKTEESAEAKPDAEAEAIARRKKALARTLSLRNAHWDRAGELKKADIAALKAARMDECRAVAQELLNIQRAIDRKERQRREEERRWREAERRWRDRRQEGGNRHYGRRPERPTHNDGLENDIRKRREIEDKKQKLQREIRAAMSKISAKASLRRRRVESAYARQKRAIEAGTHITADQMAASYEAALGEDDGTRRSEAGAKGQGDGKKRETTKRKDG